MQKIVKYLPIASMLVLINGCVATLSTSDTRASDDDSVLEDLSLTPEVVSCASQFVCIHSGTTQTSSITNTYFQYGCYKLFNQFNNHLVENNQTGQAFVDFFTGSSCEQSTLLEGWVAPLDMVVNLTPANSVRLSPH